MDSRTGREVKKKDGNKERVWKWSDTTKSKIIKSDFLPHQILQIKRSDQSFALYDFWLTCWYIKLTFLSYFLEFGRMIVYVRLCDRGPSSCKQSPSNIHYVSSNPSKLTIFLFLFLIPYFFPDSLMTPRRFSHCIGRPTRLHAEMSTHVMGSNNKATLSSTLSILFAPEGDFEFLYLQVHWLDRWLWI